MKTGSAGKCNLLLIVFSRVISIEAFLFSLCSFLIVTFFSVKLISTVLFSALSFWFLLFFTSGVHNVL